MHFISDCCAQVLELTYENLLRDNSQFTKLSSLFGLSVDHLMVHQAPDGDEKTLRLHPNSCAEKVENWGEISTLLRQHNKSMYLRMCNEATVNRI